MARPRKSDPTPSESHRTPTPIATTDEKQPATKSQITFITLFKEIVPLVSGITVFLVVVLWFCGRRYTQGIFDTMNIPISEVSFSNWEYGDFGWTYTVFILMQSLFIILSVFLGLRSVDLIRKSSSKYEFIFYSVMLIILILTLPTFIGITTKSWYYFAVALFCVSSTLFMIYYQSKNNDKSITVISMAFCLLYFLMVISVSSIAKKDGSEAAIKSYVEDTVGLRIITTKPLIRDYPSQVISNTTPLYLYENFNILIVNNNKYFLATGLTDQCRPEKVFVLKAEDVASVEYTTKAPLKPGCVPAEPAATTVPISSTTSLTTTPALTITIPIATP